MVNGSVARLGRMGIAVADFDWSVAIDTEVPGIRLTEMSRYDENTAGHRVAVLAGTFVCGSRDTIRHRLSIFTLRKGDRQAKFAREGRTAPVVSAGLQGDLT